MKFSIFFFLFAFFTTGFFAKENLPLLWGNLSISKEGKEQATIVFREKKSGKSIFEIDQKEKGTVGEIGIYKSKLGNFFYHSYHSGGESGGTYLLDLYEQKGKYIKQVSSLEASGHGKIDIIHLHPYWKEEIMRYNERFYGKEEWSLKPLYQTGFSEIIFPEYFVPEKNIKGKSVLANVSFRKQNRDLLKPYLISAEKKMQSLFGGSSSQKEESKDIVGVLQYYFYKSMFGEEKDAIAKLEKLNIQINYQGKKTSLLSFLKEKREEILKH